MQPAPYPPYWCTGPNPRIGGDLQRLYGRWAGTDGHEPTPAAGRPTAFPQLQLADGGRTAATGVYLLQHVPATGQPLAQRVVVE